MAASINSACSPSSGVNMGVFQSHAPMTLPRYSILNVGVHALYIKCLMCTDVAERIQLEFLVISRMGELRWLRGKMIQ